ncbi:tRNA (adenosine(37)-N6)-threonylcarbamoyltransferase complex dimerization subunit type 1 TsaB [Patescibacteria group bacterium]|nr:tRNA (adenosine(37)-N6)-threonylcarbamoyltransferase complex dimerization subunit type 1 TsaB [Patescibacteria group bacterium]
MILFINTSQTDLIQLKLIKNDEVVGQLESREEYKQSELLLGMIDKIIKNQRLKIKDLKLVAIVSGPGAFSALRLGVATANALAWSLKIPIIEVKTSEAEDDETLLKALKEKVFNHQSSSNNHQSSVIIPKYGKEPNITESKK